MTKECSCEVNRDNKRYHDEIIYCPLHAKAPEMYEGLRVIAEGRGTFDRDPLKHAANVIEEHKAIARALLREIEEG